MLVLIVVGSLMMASFATTRLEVASVYSSANRATGFFSAEAGLNVRGEMIRDEFLGYLRPTGASPDPEEPCEGGNVGDGDFECLDLDYNNRRVSTYVTEDATNNALTDAERTITIPPGERFAGLKAVQYRYTVVSEAFPANDERPEAILGMDFRARLVPLFQFAAFYNKDLEILPGPAMTLNGPVHVNGDLYLNANNTLTIGGTITVGGLEGGSGGALWRGRKDTNACTGTVRVNDANAATNPDPAIGCPRRSVPQTELDAWNGRIETGMDPLTVPPPEEFTLGGPYWQQADLVVALDLRGGLAAATVIVPNRPVGGGIAGITPNVPLTAILNNVLACPGIAARSYNIRVHPLLGGLPALPGTRRAVEWSNSFRDRRENPNNANARNAYRLMLEVDLRALFNCIRNNPQLLSDGPSAEDTLADTSDGGLVFYFTVLGPFSEDASSGYGVRIRNASVLASTIAAAPQIRGLTIVSDQAVWLQGDYNLDGAAGANWRPAAVISDAVNLLSNNFTSQWGNHNGSVTNASSSTYQVAFVSGTRTTGGVDGVAGQGGAYNGGLENYPVLHENWNGDLLTYLGSFVSLREPEHSTGAWSGSYYSPPNRNWGFDTRFNDAQRLPPLSPRFVFLVQERFVRDFDR